MVAAFIKPSGKDPAADTREICISMVKLLKEKLPPIYFNPDYPLKLNELGE